MALDTAAGLARIEYGDLADIKAGYVKALYQARFAPQETLEASLKALLPKDGSLIARLAGSGHLLIAGLRPQVQEALMALGFLDSGAEPVEVTEIEPKHVPASTLAAKIEQVVQKRKTAGGVELRGGIVASASGSSILLVAPKSELPTWTGWLEQFDRPQALVTRGYVPRRFALEDTAKLIEEVVTVDGKKPASWRLVRDNLTGTLLVTAPLDVQGRVEELFQRLEGTDVAGRRGLRSISVAHRDVEELVSLLEGLLRGDARLLDPRGGPIETSGRGGTGGTNTDPSSSSSSTATAPPSSPERTAVDIDQGDLTLVADKDTNRVLAFGETRMLDQLESLVATLDVAHPQVLVEVLVVSLTENQMRDLGLELRGGGERGGSLWEVASLFGLGAPELGGTSIPSPEGSGGTGVVLDPGSYVALLRALASVNHGRSLSVPKVLVSNHQDATLDSALQTPYISTAATNTVATTSLGGTSDAGTSVTVTPHILDGDRLRLEYEVSLSSFVGEAADPALPPPRQENKLQSTVTLPDGFAIAVGGLDVETESEGTRYVPGLGDLPVLGALFRSTSKTRTTNRFFVFLRCSVLHSEGYRHLLHLSERPLAEAGLGGEFPVLEPRIIR